MVAYNYSIHLHVHLHYTTAIIGTYEQQIVCVFD